MDRGILDRTHLRFFTLTSFERFLAQAGLTVEELLVTPAPLLLLVPPRYHGCPSSTPVTVPSVARYWRP